MENEVGRDERVVNKEGIGNKRKKQRKG